MKRLIGSAFAVAMLIGTSALAAPGGLSNQKIAQGQEQQQGRQRGDAATEGRGSAQTKPNRGTEGNGRGQVTGNRGSQAGAPTPGQGATTRGARGNNRGQVTGNQNPQAGGPPSGQGAANRGPRGNNRGAGQIAKGRGAAVGPVEHGPAQFEKRAFQRNVTAPQRFRAGVFHPPVGWQYSRWAYGQYLPPAFRIQTYWIASFWLYGLDRPPLGCEWVRSGPDALLVDTSSGEILEAEYNVFY